METNTEKSQTEGHKEIVYSSADRVVLDREVLHAFHWDAVFIWYARLALDGHRSSNVSNLDLIPSRDLTINWVCAQVPA